MAAITWQNINAPSFRDASLMMDAAQKSVSGGFDKFAELLKQREATDTANWGQVKQNNTNEFLNQLRQYRTPEEMQAAQASGALDAMRQRMGAQVDQAAIGAAEDTRPALLQQRAIAGMEFNKQALAERFRPQTDAALAEATMNRPDAVNAILSANPDMPKAQVLAALNTAQRSATQEQRLTNADVRAAEAQKSTITYQGANTDYLVANTAKIEAETKKVKAENDPAYISSKTAKEKNQAILKDSYLGADTLGTKEGDAALYAGLKAIGMDADKQQNTVAAFTQLSRQKGYEEMPVSLILSAVGNRANDWFGRWEWKAVDQYKEDLKNPSVAMNLEAGRQAKANLLKIGKGPGEVSTEPNPFNQIEHKQIPALTPPAATVFQGPQITPRLSPRFMKDAEKAVKAAESQAVGPRVDQLRRQQLRLIE